MYLPNKSHRRKYSVTQVSKQYPSLIRVIDISITVTQVSTQCPYPISHRRKYYSHLSKYTMYLPNKSHRRKYSVTQVSTQCPYLIRVIDISITVTQVSTQCPYPVVIDVSITPKSVNNILTQ